MTDQDQTQAQRAQDVRVLRALYRHWDRRPDMLGIVSETDSASRDDIIAALFSAIAAMSLDPAAQEREATLQLAYTDAFYAGRDYGREADAGDVEDACEMAYLAYRTRTQEKG